MSSSQEITLYYDIINEPDNPEKSYLRHSKNPPETKISQVLKRLKLHEPNKIVLKYKGDVHQNFMNMTIKDFPTTDRLQILCKISVKYRIKCTFPAIAPNPMDEHTCQLNGNAKIKDLWEEALKQCKIERDHINPTYITVTWDQKKADHDKLVAEFDWNKDFIISYHIPDTDEDKKIETMKHYTENPSQHKSPEEFSYRRRQLAFQQPICDHRDGANGDDVTLYYPGFQRFIDQCDTVTLDGDDYTFTNEICTQMSNYYYKDIQQGETKRKNCFKAKINDYIKDTGKLQSGDYPTKFDAYIDPSTCVIVEAKNESNSAGAESYSQAVAYYVQTLPLEEEQGCNKPIEQCPAPGYLIELVGPHLFISGAVYGKYVFVDRLVDPVWLVPQNQKAMIRIARVFKALKDAIRAIRRYYTALPLPPPQYHPDRPDLIQIRHPIVTLHKVDDEKAEISITYTKRIQANMFEGRALGLGNLIIHFVENYNRDVHNLMHKNGLAPEIVEYAKAKETRYMAIIMKRINGATSFADYLKTGPDRSQKEAISKECEKVLATMHREGLCHGNFAHESILIQQQQQDKKIFVVNFQFSGKFREERHGMIITPEGDDASLKQIKKLLEIQ